MSESSASASAASSASVPVVARAYPVHVRQNAVEAVNRYALLAASTPLIPVPVLDSLTMSGVQVAMIEELSRHYGQEFSKNIAQTALGAGAGGLLSLFISQSGPAMALKTIALAVPVIGPLLRFGTGPLVLATYTYVLGMAFIHHYETGGKFVDFDQKKFRAYVNYILADHAWPGFRASLARPVNRA
jgi:uncharacterized protein (DUF697 family)